MPILPLDHPEPFAATLGVMMYPGVDGADPLKARTFAAQYLSVPLQRFHDAGNVLPYEQLLRIATGAGAPLDDLKKRNQPGRVMGEMLNTFLALTNTAPALASWSNAGRIVEKTVHASARTTRFNARSAFISVAHLWAAWSIRDGRFMEYPDVGYSGYDDFQSFLAEAESLRDWGQKWRAPRAKSEPVLPPDVWRVPDDWKPPERQPGWPRTGAIPFLEVRPELLDGIKPQGRPKRRS
jgi:hypothetical protein